MLQHPTSERPNGFTLIEIAVVLVTFAILVTLTGGAVSGQLEASRRSVTNRNMDKVDAAIVNYVSANGRMPCPADGALPQTDANWGLEQRNLALAPNQCTVMARGVLPWRTLGLAVTEVTDGWQSLFTYRVQHALTIDNGMRMTDCDPAGTNPTAFGTTPTHLCNPACVTGVAMTSCNAPNTFLTDKGLRVENAAGLALNNPGALGAVPLTGAAYVLISAGPTYGPAYNDMGVLVPSNTTVGTAEAMNGNNQALQTFYVDSDLNATNTTNHFDDVVRRPSVATVITKANLGPRAH